jgi:hypothetical protein
LPLPAQWPAWIVFVACTVSQARLQSAARRAQARWIKGTSSFPESSKSSRSLSAALPDTPPRAPQIVYAMRVADVILGDQCAQGRVVRRACAPVDAS